MADFRGRILNYVTELTESINQSINQSIVWYCTIVHYSELINQSSTVLLVNFSILHKPTRLLFFFSWARWSARKPQWCCRRRVRCLLKNWRSVPGCTWRRISDALSSGTTWPPRSASATSLIFWLISCRGMRLKWRPPRKMRYEEAVGGFCFFSVHPERENLFSYPMHYILNCFSLNNWIKTAENLNFCNPFFPIIVN